MTIIAGVKMNGCYNRAPLQKTQQVQDGWTWTQQHYSHEGSYVPQQRRLITIHTRWDSNCKYDRKDVDERCEGCRWVDYQKEYA